MISIVLLDGMSDYVHAEVETRNVGEEAFIKVATFLRPTMSYHHYIKMSPVLYLISLNMFCQLPHLWDVP